MNQSIDHHFQKSDATLGSKVQQQQKLKSEKNLLKERSCLMLKVTKKSQTISPIQEYSTMVKSAEVKVELKKNQNCQLSKDIKGDM